MKKLLIATFLILFSSSAFADWKFISKETRDRGVGWNSLFFSELISFSFAKHNLFIFFTRSFTLWKLHSSLR